MKEDVSGCFFDGFSEHSVDYTADGFLQVQRPNQQYQVLKE